MAYVVTAALVIAKRSDNSDAYFYNGSVLPEGLKDGEADRLVEAGMVEKVDAAGEDKPTRGRPRKSDD